MWWLRPASLQVPQVKLLVLVLALVMAMMSTCCLPSSSSPTTDPVADLTAKTVAVVRIDDGEIAPCCTGVWVSSFAILTADHCFDEAALGTVVPYLVNRDLADNHPRPRESVLYARDKAADLALLFAFDRPDHPIARVANMVTQGQVSREMGHPIGLWYSFSVGNVAAVRWATFEGQTRLWVQSTTPTSRGSSGGGLFDDHGDLIGITDAVYMDGQNLNLFVHPVYIRDFLAKEKL